MNPLDPQTSELERVRAMHARDHQAGRHDQRFGVAACPLCPDVDGEAVLDTVRTTHPFSRGQRAV